MKIPSTNLQRRKNNQILGISLAVLFATAGGVLGAVTADNQGTDEIRPAALKFAKLSSPQQAALPAINAQSASASAAQADATKSPDAYKLVPVSLTQPVEPSVTPAPAQAEASLPLPPTDIPTFRVGQQIAPAAATSAVPSSSIDMQQLISEHHCLSEVLYYEARGEPQEGKLAIAEVVFHRMRKASYPHSICGIVHQGVPGKCQFSFACKDSETRDQEKNARDWRNAQGLAAKILGGTMPLGDLTGNATHFHAVSADFDWPGLVRTVQIGNNVFYREPDRGRAS